MTGNLSYMKSNTTKLGDWVRDGLNQINKNQAWLAEKVGVQPPQISRIISGSSEAPPDLLSAIADALGKPRIQAYRAAGYLDPQPVTDTWVEEMSHKLNMIPANMRGVAGRFIESVIASEEPKSKPKPKAKPSKA